MVSKVREVFLHYIEHEGLPTVHYAVHAPNKNAHLYVRLRYSEDMSRSEFHKRIRLPAISALKNEMARRKIKLSDLEPLPVPYQARSRFALL